MSACIRSLPLAVLHQLQFKLESTDDKWQLVVRPIAV